jgi:hypothetical protein
VEVRFSSGSVILRSTLDPEHQVEFTEDEWATFVEGVRGGEFDPP